MNSTIAWLLWIGLFAVIEGIAIFKGTVENTLSYKLRDWLGLNPKDKRPWRYLGWIVVTVFVGWLWIHLVFGFGM